jgi:Uma2 family endonuclease
VKPTRFRIPDVCIVLGQPDGQIFRRPPFLCIEVLSNDDRMSRVQERIDDYLAMGVRYVWVLDPASRRAYVATAATGLREVREAVLRTENPALDLPLDAVFA